MHLCKKAYTFYITQNRLSSFWHFFQGLVFLLILIPSSPSLLWTKLVLFYFPFIFYFGLFSFLFCKI